MNSAAGGFSSTVAEQAVDWLVELQESGPDTQRQQAWQRWLEADAEHRRAWEHIQQVNLRLRGVPGPLAHATLKTPPSAARRRALKALLLLGVAGATGLGLRQQQLVPPLLADYRSPFGERRQMPLDDGSQLHLNTASAVDVRFDGQRRLLHLLEGQLLLSVASEPRPLYITTAQGVIVAQQGRIDVRQLAGRTQVAVLEGTASLSPQALRGYPLVLQRGRQASFGSQQWSAPATLDANSGAWVDGMLVAAGMRLGDFIEELGRYRRGHLQCDPRVADLRLSGSYPLDDTDRILDLLTVALPLQIRRRTRYWVSVEARV
jgi:transmembrane sensor